MLAEVKSRDYTKRDWKALSYIDRSIDVESVEFRLRRESRDGLDSRRRVTDTVATKYESAITFHLISRIIIVEDRLRSDAEELFTVKNVNPMISQPSPSQPLWRIIRGSKRVTRSRLRS